MVAKVLLIDNYDSFTYNIYQYLSELGAEVTVIRNDKITAAQALAIAPSHLVISPGPKRPEDAGVCNELIRKCEVRAPVLGVCLGHQCIGYAYGATVSRAARIMHGKMSRIDHDGRGLFEGVPAGFEATRYHSLLVQEKTLPPFLEVSARTPEGEVMGLRHAKFRIEGVQFHPESIMTKPGKTMLKNFLAMTP